MQQQYHKRSQHGGRQHDQEQDCPPGCRGHVMPALYDQDTEKELGNTKNYYGMGRHWSIEAGEQWEGLETRSKGIGGGGEGGEVEEC